MDFALWFALAPAGAVTLLMLVVEVPALIEWLASRIDAVWNSEAALADLEAVAKDKAFEGGALVGLVTAFSPQTPVPPWFSVIVGVGIFFGAWRIAAIAKAKRQELEQVRLEKAAEASRATWRD